MNPRALGRVIFWVMFTALIFYLGKKYGWKRSLIEIIFNGLDKKKNKKN